MKGKSMHRKKFLSFLGMAAIAAPIIAKEIPQADEVKPLELKDGPLGIVKLGPPEPVDPVAVGDWDERFQLADAVMNDSVTLTSGQLLVYNGEYNELGWKDPFITASNDGWTYTKPERGKSYSSWNIAGTPFTPSVGTIKLVSDGTEELTIGKGLVWTDSGWVELE